MEKVDLDGKCYLFPSLVGKASNLIIVSHGHQFFFNKGNQEYFSAPVGTSLHFYTKDGLLLASDGYIDVTNKRLQIIETIKPGNLSRDYVLRKAQFPENNPQSNLFGSYSGIISDLQNQKKELERLQKIDSDPYILGLLGSKAGISTAKPFDILTIRNTKHASSKIYTINPFRSPFRLGIRFSEVLQLLAQYRYQYANIHCIFCRKGSRGV